MDPLSIAGTVTAVFGLVDVLTRNLSFLSDVRKRFNRADLAFSLLLSQLSTFKVCLDRIAQLLDEHLAPDSTNQQLMNDFGTSIESCKVVIFVLDEKIQNYQRKERLGKVAFAWDEAEMKDYSSLLANQIDALHLMLTVLQWFVLLAFPFSCRIVG